MPEPARGGFQARRIATAPKNRTAEKQQRAHAAGLLPPRADTDRRWPSGVHALEHLSFRETNRDLLTSIAFPRGSNSGIAASRRDLVRRPAGPGGAYPSSLSRIESGTSCLLKRRPEAARFGPRGIAIRPNFAWPLFREGGCQSGRSCRRDHGPRRSPVALHRNPHSPSRPHRPINPCRTAVNSPSDTDRTHGTGRSRAFPARSRVLRTPSHASRRATCLASRRRHPSSGRPPR